ncbi:E3 SUMO-protein ligase RanBP2 [Stylophora pistillata]|uniref:Nuclear pore complex protein Nup153 n=1 Tax=Stylophora pistillata TaxID=50429 RepID=A0A2B4SZU2_STYPI|nr:E3 SUMO-protein ligase RanBP2 [Stylophora pistillata]
MDGDKVISERERALLERIARLEKKLEGCQSQIDIIDDQRQQLEERAIKMESALLTTTKELSNARKQLREKDMSSSHLAEKLESMTQQIEEYKSLLFEEREKTKHSMERLETVLSRVEAEMTSRKEFQGFLNEMLVAVKEELHTPLQIVFNKLTRLENTLHESPQEMTHYRCQAGPSFKKVPYSPDPGCRVLQSEAANTAQDVMKEPSQASSNFQSPGGSALASSKLFTIGRADPNEEKEDEINLSPSKRSPSKQGNTFLQKPDSSTSYTEDVHFEPLIPLPERVEVQTGEEDEEVMFSSRAKLYRYDKDQGEPGSEQHTEDSNNSLSLSNEQRPDEEADDSKDDHKHQEISKNQTSANLTKEEGKNEDAGKDIMTKFKPAEGSWECEICMVNNNSDKVECAACGSVKPGAEVIKEQRQYSKSLFPFGFGASSSGGVFSFGSSGSAQGDPKPVFTFGSQNQTSIPSSEVPFRFGALGQGGKLGELQTNKDPKASSLIDSASNKGTDENKDDLKQIIKEGVDVKEEARVDKSSTEENTSSLESDKDSALALQDTKETLPNEELKFLFGSPNVSSLSFQSIANSSLTNSPFGQKPKSGNSASGFSGSGTKLFTSPSSADRYESTTEEDHEGPHFEPIIPLPEKIDVKTGEEDEEVMFSHRAKLYRFVAEDKQWKERGVGDIKLLKNRQSGKLRVLMRRDKVLKVCANHQITTEMKLQPNAGSNRSWVWSTMADFSEGECRAEQLAVRFKSEETAKQFKEKFEECQKMLKNPTAVKLQVKPKSIDWKEDPMSKFKPAEGSWECTVCMVINDSDKVECIACGSIKPGAEPSQGQKKEVKPSFLFGSGASSSGEDLTSGFGVSVQEGDNKPVYTFGSSNQTPSPSTGFSFTFCSSNQRRNLSEYHTNKNS